MPIYSASVTSPAQFDGLTAATGLFDPAASTGSAAIQVRVNSISFSGASSITSWTLSIIDPSDNQTTLWLTGTAVDGGAGNLIMPTNPDGVPWRFAWVTVTMVGTGILKIDYDFEATEG